MGIAKGVVSLSDITGFAKLKNYPLHGRTRTLHELEHENETLKRMNSRLQRHVMACEAIICDLQLESERSKEEIARLKRKLAGKQE